MTPEEYNARSKEIETGGYYENITALVRIAQTHLGLDVDGKFGPQTRAAVEAWLARQAQAERARTFQPRSQRAADALARMRGLVARITIAIEQPKRAPMYARLGYGMGYGGKNPDAPHPWERAVDSVYRCDCSGGVAWAYKFSRRVVEDGAESWRNTDGLEADARGTVPGDLGERVPWNQARPGDIIVDGKGSKVGHCGIVGDVDARGPLTCVHINAGGGWPCDETSVERAGFVDGDAVILAVR